LFSKFLAPFSHFIPNMEKEQMFPLMAIFPLFFHLLTKKSPLSAIYIDNGNQRVYNKKCKEEPRSPVYLGFGVYFISLALSYQ